MTNKIGGGYFLHAAVKRARESKAQLLGLLGCIYLESNPVGLQSLDKSAASFCEAINIYQEMGYDDSDSQIIWARHNLNMVGKSRSELRDPPATPPLDPPAAPSPPPLSSSMSSAPTSLSNKPPIDRTTGNDDNNNDELKSSTIDFDDDIDSTAELDELLAVDAKNSDQISGGDHGDHGDDDDDNDDDDDVFLGVETGSADELDDFFSRAGVSKSCSAGGGTLQSNDQRKVSVAKTETDDAGETRDSFEGKWAAVG